MLTPQSLHCTKVNCSSSSSFHKWEKWDVEVTFPKSNGNLLIEVGCIQRKKKNDWSAWKVWFGLIKMNIHPVCLLKSPQMLGGIWYYNFPIQWPFLDYFQQNQLLLRYGICISLFEFFFSTSILILWCLETLQIIIYFGVMRQQDHEEGLWSLSEKTEVEPIHPAFQSTICKMGILFALPTTIVQIKRRDYIKALCKV